MTTPTGPRVQRPARQPGAGVAPAADRTATLEREHSLQTDGAPPLTSISRVAASDSFVYVGQQGGQESLRHASGPKL